LQTVEHTTIEVEAAGVQLTATIRLNAGPADRESVCLDAELLQEVEILVEVVVVVGGDVPGVTVQDGPRLVRERVPDRWAAAVGVYGAFDLIGGCSYASEETVGKSGQDVVLSSWVTCPLPRGGDG